MSGRRGDPLLDTLVIFVVIFAVQVLAEVFSIALLAGLFVLSMPLTVEPWTLVTSVYAHNGPTHLVANAIALIVFGWPIARATTRLRFHAFFVTVGAIAGASQVVAVWLLGSQVGVLGASGAVFGLLGYLIVANRLSTTLSNYVPLPRWLAAIGYLALAAVVTYLAGTGSGVAVIAHFTGFLLGLIAGRFKVLRA